MKTLACILCCVVGTCAVSSFSVDYIDPATGVTVGSTYSSKGGLSGRVVIEGTK